LAAQRKKLLQLGSSIRWEIFKKVLHPPFMITLLRREFVVEAPLAAAWQHLTQVEKWPNWARHPRQKPET